MKKLLLTGAGGFIGQATLNELLKTEQWEIYAVTSGRRNIVFPQKVYTIKADLLDLARIDEIFAEIRPNTVLHLAWQMQGASDRFNVTNLAWLEVSLRVLRAFVANNGQRLVFAGSSSEYGGDGILKPHEDFSGFTETATASPVCLYGECKYTFGNIASRLLNYLGKEYLHARIFPVYGPGEESLHAASAFAVDTLLRGKPFVCKAPNNFWDFVYIGDIAADLSALTTGSVCGYVNIASGTPIKVGEFFRLIAKEIGMGNLLRYENINEPGRILFGDTMLMNRILGKPKRTPIEQGIKKLVAWRKKLIEGNFC